MSATSGVNQLGDYATPATDALKVAALLALIPNPDATPGTGAVAGGGFLDEMSPGCASQLRVELAALQTAVAQV